MSIFGQPKTPKPDAPPPPPTTPTQANPEIQGAGSKTRNSPGMQDVNPTGGSGLTDPFTTNRKSLLG